MLFRAAFRAGALLAGAHAFAPLSAQRASRAAMTAAAHPITLLVTVEIEEARVPAFLEAMKIDAEGSRTEEGCLRFDLLKDQEKPNTYMFYEVYKDSDAITKHKTFDHYKAWGDFKAGGGVVSQTVSKMDAVDFTY
mmetsp:Transcript_20479/g.61209  ORF Transcript_20479/g.61209 Transcript_20479/m.61209 type:complete len:136 (-) Transcript_20479:52-459(-)